jgi:diguanylate cyclase (GGDEF)-like protein
VAASQPSARIAVVIRNVVWVGIIAHAGFIPVFWLLGQPWLAAFNVLSVATWVVATVLNRRGSSTSAMWLITLEVATHAALAVSALGWASGFQYYLIPLIPFVMFNDRLPTAVVAATSAAVFLAFLSLRIFAPDGTLDSPFARAQSYANIAIPFLALALVSVYFRLASTTAERHLEKIAETDPLTGLLNRRRMSERLSEEHARASGGGKPFSVVIADVDHFKKINDTHGHAAGDRVLRAVAQLLTEGLRGRDAAARWGGEEFLMLLPETTLEGARDVADRLRASAEQRLRELSELERHVTLTFGVAVFAPGVSVEACLKSADEALYAGKRGGRNRVVPAA